MKILVAADYTERRIREYPFVTEQLGAIWKILHAMQMGDVPPEDAIAIQDAIDEVKAKYTKEV